MVNEQKVSITPLPPPLILCPPPPPPPPPHYILLPALGMPTNFRLVAPTI